MAVRDGENDAKKGNKLFKMNLVENYWFTLPAVNNIGCLDICFMNDGTIALKTDFILKIVNPVSKFLADGGPFYSGEAFISIEDFVLNSSYPFDPLIFKGGQRSDAFANFYLRTVSPISATPPAILDYAIFHKPHSSVSFHAAVCLSNYEILLFSLENSQWGLISKLSDTILSHLNDANLSLDSPSVQNFYSSLALDWAPFSKDSAPVLTVAGKSDYINFFVVRESPGILASVKVAALSAENLKNKWAVKVKWLRNGVLVLGLSDGSALFFEVRFPAVEIKLIKTVASDSFLDRIVDIKDCVGGKGRVVVLILLTQCMHRIDIVDNGDSFEFSNEAKISLFGGRNPMASIVSNETAVISVFSEMKAFSLNDSLLIEETPRSLSLPVSLLNAISQKIVSSDLENKDKQDFAPVSSFCPCGLSMVAVVPNKYPLNRNNAPGNSGLLGFVLPAEKDLAAVFRKSAEFLGSAGNLHRHCVANCVRFCESRAETGTCEDYVKKRLELEKGRDSDDVAVKVLFCLASSSAGKNSELVSAIRGMLLKNYLVRLLEGEVSGLDLGLISNRTLFTLIKSDSYLKSNTKIKKLIKNNPRFVCADDKCDETCFVCSAKIDKCDFYVQKCPNGHKLDRCMTTFELVKPRDVKGRCFQCEGVFAETRGLEKMDFVCPICALKINLN